MKQDCKSNTVFPIIREALNAVNQINNKNCSLDDFLDFKLSDKNLRKIISHLLLSYFRHRQLIDDFLQQNLKKSNQSIREYLSMAISHTKYQTGISAESSVNAWVEFSKRQYSSGFSKLVNAILRKALQCKELEKTALPKTIADRWEKSFGNEFVREMNNLYGEYAPFTFRCALNFELDTEFLQEINGREILLENNVFHWYQAENIKAVLESNYLKEGKIYIQDCATAFATSLLAKHELKPKNLIDLCGAPGGKAIMASEIFNNQLKMTVLDKSAKRQELTKRNFACRNLAAEILVADAAEFQSKEKYDIVIADVPCSNSGVFRKRPDALWRLNEESILEVAEIQKNILANAAQLCAENGVILYSTCSIEELEDQEQLRKFLTEHPQFELLSEQLVLPDKLIDGAYSALLHKK